MSRAMTSELRSRACPQCGTEVTGHPHFTLWCQACDWNIDPAPAKPQGRLGRIAAKRADKLALRLFQQVRAHPPSKRRGRLTTVIVYSLACAVHLVTCVVVAAAILLALATSIIVPVRVVGAGFLAMVAWYVQPFRRRRQPQRATLTRQDAPSLFLLVDEVARAIGAPTVAVVRLSADFNAHYFRLRRGRKGIELGLTLWNVLEPQERVALLGHELGHGVNGDLRSTIMVGRALTTLNAWYLLLRPSSRRVTRAPGGSPVSGLVNITEDLLAPLVLIPAVLLILLTGRTLALVANRHGQRREYYADELSARAGGTAGAVGLSQKMLIGDFCLRSVVQAVRFARAADPWQVLRSEVAAIPPGEWERRRRLARLRLNRIDVSHPPSSLRADLLRARPSRTAAVTLAPERSEIIDAELARGASELQDRVRSTLGLASSIASG